MRRAILLIIGIVALASFAFSQEQSRRSAEMQSLLEQRLKAAEKEHAAISALINQGAGVAEELVGAVERVLQAKLGLAETTEQKLAAYDEALEFAQELQKRLEAQAGQVFTISEVARTQYWVLDLKIRRLQLEEGQP